MSGAQAAIWAMYQMGMESQYGNRPGPTDGDSTMERRRAMRERREHRKRLAEARGISSTPRRRKVAPTAEEPPKGKAADDLARKHADWKLQQLREDAKK